jgi:ring-1,2-phenylacetyl-CoA epoxidase subunit PaaC
MLATEKREALAEALLALADDELILGHRASEWCGHAPLLEEDIAFANLALDEIGHASLWYTRVAELREEDANTYPDQLVYFRPPAAFRNLQLVELPRGDWAFSLLRQYLFDTAEAVRLPALAHSAYQPVAEIARKIQTEELYHLRHSQAWVKRLSLGTPESHQRMQKALDELWPFTLQIFVPMPDEAWLVENQLLPASAALGEAWMGQVMAFLQTCELEVPEVTRHHLDRSEHTPYLKALLAELQSVARLDPAAGW